MKTKLTPEQSAKLIELGVSPERASGLILNSDDFTRIELPTEIKSCIIFTLLDIIKLLPIALRLEGGIYYAFDVERGMWIAGYELDRKLYARAEELIDALYLLFIKYRERVCET